MVVTYLFFVFADGPTIYTVEFKNSWCTVCIKKYLTNFFISPKLGWEFDFGVTNVDYTGGKKF